DRVECERGLLAVPDGLVRLEARRAVAAQVRDDHPAAGRDQQRGDLLVAVDVVRPAVQQHDRGSIGGARVDVADVQEAGVDLRDRAERRVGCGRHDATAATASRITSVTAWGCEIMITCEPSTSVMVAPARSAIERVTSAPAALSPVATTAHEGRFFHAGVPFGSENADSATGRWVAAISAASSVDRSAANASWNLVGS